MFRHEHDVLRIEIRRALRPLIRVDRWINFAERRRSRVILFVLPGVGREVHEHSDFQIRPRSLIRRRPRQPCRRVTALRKSRDRFFAARDAQQFARPRRAQREAACSKKLSSTDQGVSANLCSFRAPASEVFTIVSRAELSLLPSVLSQASPILTESSPLFPSPHISQTASDRVPEPRDLPIPPARSFA